MAYETLVVERRRGLHARAVEAIEHLFAARLDEQSERRAQHGSRGEVWEKAVTYLRSAVTKAQLRSAHATAVVLLEDALRALANLPGDEHLTRDAVSRPLEINGSLFPLAQLPRADACLREASTLSARLDDRRLQALTSAFAAHHFRGPEGQRRALEMGERALPRGRSR